MSVCAGWTAKGRPCKNRPMWGHTLCGPHADAEAARKPKPKKRRAKPVDGMLPCPGCGLLVRVAGKLVSYHEPINGCRVADLSGAVE